MYIKLFKYSYSIIFLKVYDNVYSQNSNNNVTENILAYSINHQHRTNL